MPLLVSPNDIKATHVRVSMRCQLSSQQRVPACAGEDTSPLTILLGWGVGGGELLGSHRAQHRRGLHHLIHGEIRTVIYEKPGSKKQTIWKTERTASFIQTICRGTRATRDSRAREREKERKTERERERERERARERGMKGRGRGERERARQNIYLSNGLSLSRTRYRIGGEEESPSEPQHLSCHSGKESRGGPWKARLQHAALASSQTITPIHVTWKSSVRPPVGVFGTAGVFVRRVKAKYWKRLVSSCLHKIDKSCS